MVETLEIVCDLTDCLEISGKEFIFSKIVFLQLPVLLKNGLHHRSFSMVLPTLKEQKMSKLKITDWLQIY